MGILIPWARKTWPGVSLQSPRICLHPQLRAGSSQFLFNDTARLAQVAFLHVAGQCHPCCWHCLGTAVTHAVPAEGTQPGHRVTVSPAWAGSVPARPGGEAGPVLLLLGCSSTRPPCPCPRVQPRCHPLQQQIYFSKLRLNPNPSGFPQCHPQPCPHTTKWGGSWGHLAQHPNSHFSPQLSQLGQGPEGQPSHSPQWGLTLGFSQHSGCNAFISFLKNLQGQSLHFPTFYSLCPFWGL